tara:strand:- start:143 stop:442 length:300 start_codon:yes stop_codon:yes gene_type:complete
MKLTNKELKRIIKEELENIMTEMVNYNNMELPELEREFEAAVDTDLEEAKKIAAAALKIDPNIGEVWGGYIETLIEKGQYNRSARRFFDDILNNMAMYS